MKKRIYIFVIVIIILVLILTLFALFRGGSSIGGKDNNQQNIVNSTAGSTSNSTVSSTSSSIAAPTQNINYTEENSQLAALLPDKPNYKWAYYGTAEYAHAMLLNSINKSPTQTVYIISGKVADMSDGASGKPPEYFNLKITYSIKDGILRQDKSEKAMMDSIFDSLELIKTPLAKNNVWTQKQIDKTGKEYTLRSEITEIRQEKGAKAYTVYYKDENSDYFETRTIQEGTGVVGFTKLFMDTNNSYELGYVLNREASGY